MVSLSINWSSLSYSAGEVIKAVINARDASASPANDLAWVLSQNGVPVASGSGQRVAYTASVSGIYRITATAAGESAQSSVCVGAGFEIQASPQPPEVAPTCLYIGAAYSAELRGSGLDTPNTPFPLACLSQDVVLLPGTTHISFDLDPDQNRVDDEVVVRTQTGNYTLKGAVMGGLYDEKIGYDYTGGQPILSAPSDGVLRMTVEALNVHGSSAHDFNFRVRIKCWRQVSPIYRYTKCQAAAMPGGSGDRAARFAVLFTELEVLTDAITDRGRLGSPSTATTYTTPEVTTIPLASLSTDGSPNPIQASSGYFFTDSNWYAVYEPADGGPELNAKAVAGDGSGFQPFYFTLVEPADPPVVQRISRLKGRMAVYMARGGVTKGSIINVKVLTGKLGQGSEVTCSLTVDSDLFNHDNSVFQRVGSVDVDIEDYQFSGNGLVAVVTVDESSANPDALPCDDPDPVVADDYVYTGIYAPSIVYAGACFSSPEIQETIVETPISSAGSLQGCYDGQCGPIGLYCYTDLATGSRAAQFQQPLYFPAPYVAYGTNPLDCYANPLFISELSGTVYQSTVSAATDAMCGDGWVYKQCNGNDHILAVYPHSSSPHDVVFYGSECWNRVSTVAESGSTVNLIIGTFGWEAVSSGSFTPVADCLDFECTGSVPGGSSVFYRDTQTDQKLPVRFDGLNIGNPHVGVALQTISTGKNGLPEGSANVTFDTPRKFLFTCSATGKLSFQFNLTEFPRKIVIVRGGTELNFELTTGESERSIDVQSGDSIYADIGNIAGLLSARTRNKRATVAWRPVVILPRVYDSAVVTSTGSNIIQAIGFTGFDNRTGYALYDSLPQDIEQSLPNPDSILTVVSENTEYALIRTRAVGDPVPALPGNAQWYAGQLLNGDLTFKFYASREEQGAHGEMDVWLSNSPGNFPVYWKVDPYRTLVVQGGPIDVLFVMNFSGSLVRDSFRQTLNTFDQSLKSSGVAPKYGIIIMAGAPSVLGATGDSFYDYESLVATGYWNSDSFGWNFGDVSAGLTTIAQAGTLMAWTPGAARAFVVVTQNAAYDYPPGYVQPVSTIRYTEALNELNKRSTPLFGIVKPDAPVPINPFTFVLPSNVPQSYMALATATGGESFTTDALIANGTVVMQSLADAVRIESFPVMTGTNLSDISRGALRVATNGTDARWPVTYAAADGQRIVSTAYANAFLYEGKYYGPLDFDPGISSNIVGGNVVTVDEDWQTSDGALWSFNGSTSWSIAGELF